jgi:hypothetical protein
VGFRLISQTGERQREDPACPDVNVVVVSPLELSAAQLRPPLRLSNSEIRRTKPPFHPVRRRVQGLSQNSLTDFDIADRVFNSPSHPAQ